MHVRIHARARAQVRTHARAHIRTHAHARTHSPIHTHTHTLSLSLSLSHTHTHTTHSHTHTHTHTHTPLTHSHAHTHRNQICRHSRLPAAGSTHSSASPNSRRTPTSRCSLRERLTSQRLHQSWHASRPLSPRFTSQPTARAGDGAAIYHPSPFLNGQPIHYTVPLRLPNPRVLPHSRSHFCQWPGLFLLKTATIPA